MFGFLRKGPSAASSQAIEQALIQHGLPDGTTAQNLRVLTRQGQYSGRSVRYFSAFDAQQAARSGLTLRTLEDLDAHPDLVVGSGHVEHNGAISVTRRTPPAATPAPDRAQADRAGHADDAHLVFWDAEGSKTSAAHLSEAAATWDSARSTQAAEPAPRTDP